MLKIKNIFMLLSFYCILALVGGCSVSDPMDELYDSLDDIEFNSPNAQIESPTDSSSYEFGEEILFSGSGSDEGGGPLIFDWNSNVDGQIGTGETFTLDTLSVGEHYITLTTTNSEGLFGFDTVTLLIFNSHATLPDTGQTSSFSDIFGEDSDYTINQPSYTKLDSSGNPLDESAASWTMVRDNITGLIWEIKTDDGSIHDKDNLYTWNDAQDNFILTLRMDWFGGYYDWRLPTMKELSTLIHSGNINPNPAIDTTYFPNAILDWWPGYWSSTLLSGDPDSVWCQDFYEGEQYSNEISTEGYVLAVRGKQLINYLIDNEDGTVTDVATGLMWQKQSEDDAMTWEEALTYCEDLELAGHDDWRLPNRSELQSIVDYEKTSPAIDPILLAVPEMSSVLPGIYWSSTSDSRIPGMAWAVDFYFADGAVISQSYTSNNNVQAVRGGQ